MIAKTKNWGFVFSAPNRLANDSYKKEYLALKERYTALQEKEAVIYNCLQNQLPADTAYQLLMADNRLIAREKEQCLKECIELVDKFFTAKI